MDKLIRFADTAHSGDQDAVAHMAKHPPVSDGEALLIVDDRNARDVVRLSASWATTTPACVVHRGASTWVAVAHYRDSHHG